MIKERTILYFFVVCCSVALVSFRFKPNVITSGNVITIGDTTSFAPNKSAGWDMISSYLNQDTKDSVEFELILKQSNSTSWNSQQFVGTITNKLFLPMTDQKLTYNLLIGDTWTIVITTTGQCYLYQLRGFALRASSVQGSPYILPIKVRYKNN